jgi:hypothetical protein
MPDETWRRDYVNRTVAFTKLSTLVAICLTFVIVFETQLFETVADGGWLGPQCQSALNRLLGSPRDVGSIKRYSAKEKKGQRFVACAPK